jgi:hypothetical protein
VHRTVWPELGTVKQMWVQSVKQILTFYSLCFFYLYITDNALVVLHFSSVIFCGQTEHLLGWYLGEPNLLPIANQKVKKKKIQCV